MSSWQLDFGSDDFVLPDTRKKRPRPRQQSFSQRFGRSNSHGSASLTRNDDLDMAPVSKPRSKLDFYDSSSHSRKPIQQYRQHRSSSVDDWRGGSSSSSSLSSYASEKENRNTKGYRTTLITSPIPEEDEFDSEKYTKLEGKYKMLKTAYEKQRMELEMSKNHSDQLNQQNESLLKIVAQLRRENEESQRKCDELQNENRRLKLDQRKSLKSVKQQGFWDFNNDSQTKVMNKPQRASLDQCIDQDSRYQGFSHSSSLKSIADDDQKQQDRIGNGGGFGRDKSNDMFSKKHRSLASKRDRFNSKSIINKDDHRMEKFDRFKQKRNRQFTMKSGIHTSSNAEITLSGALDDSGLILDHERQREEKRRQKQRDHNRGFDDSSSGAVSSSMFGHRRNIHASSVSDPFRLDTPPELACRLPRPPPPPKTPLFNFDTVKKKRSVFGRNNNNNQNKTSRIRNDSSGVSSSDTRDMFGLTSREDRSRGSATSTIRYDRSETGSRGSNTVANRRSRSTRDLSHAYDMDATMTDRSRGSNGGRNNGASQGGFFFGRPQTAYGVSSSVNAHGHTHSNSTGGRGSSGVDGGRDAGFVDDSLLEGATEEALDLSAFVCEVSPRLDLLRADILGEPDGVQQLVCCLIELSRSKEEDWKRRSFLMKLAAAVCREAKKGSMNASEVQRFVPVVKRQLSDARSAIIREACNMVASLCIACDNRFVDNCLTHWLPLMFNGLAKTSTAVIRDAHSFALHVCIEECEYSVQSKKILPLIVRRLNNERRMDGHAGVRAECVSLLCSFINPGLSLENKRLNVICQAIYDCSTDPSQTVRQKCRQLFELFFRAYPRCLIEGLLRTSSTIEKWRRQIR